MITGKHHLHLIILLLILCSSPLFVQGHEIRPASLDIRETAIDLVEFRFRQPIRGEYTIAINPVLSSGWLNGPADEQLVTDTALIRIWRIDPQGLPLAGQQLYIRGLDRTITDVLVNITYASGAVQQHLVKAARPELLVPAEGSSGATVPEYLTLGFEHIWSGPDHLLYVLALLLLINNLRSLLLTITAFTLAHSVTLACAALGLVRLNTAAVEATISLSIIYVALELLRAQYGKTGIAQRMPWLIALVFGLLHGFGFANALQQIGLPQQAITGALLLFNLGIEIGQVLFVLALLALFLITRKVLPRLFYLHNNGKIFASYFIGSLASFWFIERFVALM